MAQRNQRGMTTVRAPVFRLERLNLTVPLQHFSHGRDPSLLDFTASALGALRGTLALVRPRHRHLVGTTGDFGTISGIQFRHNFSNVELDGALTHLQFVSNNLISFSEFETTNNLQLALGELLGCGSAACHPLAAADPLRREAARRHECPASFNKVHDFYR